LSKYQPLSEHLAHLQGGEWAPTFHELERMLGFELPKGARKETWWTKDSGHADAWNEPGWRVERVDPDKEVVKFVRESDAGPSDRSVADQDFAEDDRLIRRQLQIAGRPVPVRNVALMGGVLAVFVGAAALAARAILRRRA